jgi:CrcB protein
MIAYFIVFIGAGLGGTLRYGVNAVCARWCGIEFPWGTLFINVVGSMIMGLVAGYFATRATEAWTQQARLFAMTGILGGFTTFSAFSLDAVSLWEKGSQGAATMYVVGSVSFAIVGLVIGLAIIRIST